MFAMQEQEDHYRTFTESLDQINTVRWEAEVVAWEKDDSRPDPYATISTGACASPVTCAALISVLGATEEDIRCMLEEQDAATRVRIHQMSAVEFLSTGLELEEQA